MFDDSTGVNVSGHNPTFNQANRDIIYQNSKRPSSFKALIENVATEAFHNSREVSDAPKCRPGTRVAILDTLFCWASASASTICIQWIYGTAGSGKSTLLRTLAEMLELDGLLLASFFFCGTADRRNTDDYFISTIAYQIAHSIPTTRAHIEHAIEIDPLIFGRSLDAQAKALIVLPVTRAYQEGGIGEDYPRIIIVDGIDQCKGEEKQKQVLQVLRKMLMVPIRFAFLVASRPNHLLEKLKEENWSRKVSLQELQSHMKEEMDDLEKTVGSLRTALRQQEQSAEKLKEENRNLEFSLQELRSQMMKEKDDQEKAVESLRTALRQQEEKFKKENRNLEVSLQEIRSYFSDSQASVRHLGSEHKRLTKSLANARDTGDQRKDESERLKNIIEEMKTKRLRRNVDIGIQSDPEPVPEPVLPSSKPATVEMTLQTEPQEIIAVPESEIGIQCGAPEPVLSPSPVLVESGVGTDPIPEPALGKGFPPLVVGELGRTTPTQSDISYASSSTGDSTVQNSLAQRSAGAEDEEPDEGEATEAGADSDMEEDYQDARQSIMTSVDPLEEFHSALSMMDDDSGSEDGAESIKASNFSCIGGLRRRTTLTQSDTSYASSFMGDSTVRNFLAQRIACVADDEETDEGEATTEAIHGPRKAPGALLEEVAGVEAGTNPAADAPPKNSRPYQTTLQTQEGMVNPEVASKTSIGQPKSSDNSPTPPKDAISAADAGKTSEPFLKFLTIHQVPDDPEATGGSEFPKCTRQPETRHKPPKKGKTVPVIGPPPSGHKKDTRAKIDIFILVMGTTGAGKSFFINTLLKHQQMAVGRGFVPCTSELAFGHMDATEGYPDLKNYRIVLVDTPGFDDTIEGDLRVLEKISPWLKNSYKRGVKLGGVIYLHDISSPRHRNLQLFLNLCGDDVLDNVVLGTTKWVLKGPGSEMRHHQLVTDYWESLVKKGAQVRRFDNNSFQSAWRFIEALLANSEGKCPNQVVLQIQRELVDRRMSIPETQACRELRYALQEVLQIQKKLLRYLKADGDEDLAVACQYTSERVKVLGDQIQKLKIPPSRQLRKIIGF